MKLNLTKWSTAVVAAGVIFTAGLLPSQTYAQNARPRRAMRGQFLARARQQLGLSRDQMTQIRAVLRAERPSLVALLRRLHQARIGLREAIQAPGATPASVRAAAANAAGVQADLAVERFKLFGKIRPILTAEQLNKLEALQTRRDGLADRILGRAERAPAR